MESREVWDARLREEAEALGLRDGYKMLYCPWDTIGRSETVFLSLNPGRAPAGAALETLSDERGNSYEVEAQTTASPITEQFLKLAALLDLTPSDILTGVVAPFRSDRWGGLSGDQRVRSLGLGEEFWRQAFALRRPKRVICCGSEAAQVAARVFGAQLESSEPSGWGNIALRLYSAKDGARVVHLPHLSRFKLLSREACHAPLRRILAA